MDKATIERRANATRDHLLSKLEKNRGEAFAHRDRAVEEAETEVSRDRRERLAKIKHDSDLAVLQLEQMFNREKTLIRATFENRISEIEQCAQTLGHQAMENQLKRKMAQDAIDQEKFWRDPQMSGTGGVEAAQAHLPAVDDPLAILGLRTRAVGDLSDPLGAGADLLGGLGGNSAGVKEFISPLAHHKS